MIRLTTQEHGTTSPISATELKTVLDDASYLHLERHPFGPLPEYERRIRTDAEPAFTVYKMAADDGFAIQVRASYFIGVDWVIPGAVSILVLPKVERLDMPAMLKRVLGVADAAKEFDGLLSVRYWEKPIPDAEDCDRFLLFVAAAFLKITQRIVRKGLLKSFRTEEEIFRYRVKGKLRVSDTLRKMRFGDPFARAVCSPQSFDDDTPANRFLKLVLRRMHSVLAARSKALGSVGRILADEATRLLRAFGEVSDIRTWRSSETTPAVNPIFTEYTAALQLGRKFLLHEGIGAFKKAEREPRRILPYWIDMAQLFELYVLADLRGNAAVRDVQYHRLFKPGGEPDFLVDLQGPEIPFECCVADAKYKPKYVNDELYKDDARQLSGYGRVTKVIDWMSARGHSDRKHIIPCLIIHPDQSSENKHVDFSKLRPLKHWEDFWKIGIQIPHQQASKGLDEGNSEA